METIKTAIIGGGAAGLFLATSLANENQPAILFERGERLGRKLSATGNGQGNISNVNLSLARYFCVEKNAETFPLQKAIERYGTESLTAFFHSLGVLVQADERGRMYPTSRQASSLTDALRKRLEHSCVETRLNTYITGLQKSGAKFLLTYLSPDGERKILAERVVLCTGGKAAKNFGTDGSAYALAERLGHRKTALYPSLVQLKTKTNDIKTLKGIRVNGAGVKAYLGEKQVCSLIGDVIFTDFGVSGDGVFRASAFLTAEEQCERILSLDFLPTVDEKSLAKFIDEKRQRVACPKEELLCGIINNQIARVIAKRCEGKTERYAKELKNFRLEITGSLGFDYAQVTKGGVPLSEVDGRFESRKVKGLYFAGEILDVDGECGGFNLHFAYASACTVAQALIDKQRGQV